MKKNLILIAMVAIVGMATLMFTTLHAQPAPGAGGLPPAGQGAPPAARPGPRLGPHTRDVMAYRNAIRTLRMAKIQLQGAKDDYNGHRQSAMAACDTAIQELEAVTAAMRVELAPRPTNAPPQNVPAQPPAAPGN